LFTGDWRQIASNSGKCPRCAVSISRSASGLKVIGNNGWNAAATMSPDMTTATGSGAWTATGRTLSGKQFDMTIGLVGQERLRIQMRMHGSRRIIDAVFKRVWLGA
jgi:hypothetical protein